MTVSKIKSLHRMQKLLAVKVTDSVFGRALKRDNLFVNVSKDQVSITNNE